MFTKLCCTVVISIVAGSGAAVAKPPPGADLTTPEANWVQSLRTPDNRMSCCDVADCRKVEYRISENKIQAYIRENWVTIPEDKLVKRENPTGTAWACYDQYSPPNTDLRIYCFVGTDLF
jgi:hypothetical protein